MISIMVEMVEIPLKDVWCNDEDNTLPNIRGKVTDTTDLQEALRHHNFLDKFPIQVILHPHIAGVYLVWDGFRRVTAARAIGLESVPCLISEGTPAEALLWQLAANLRKDQPPIVTDKSGQVTGGLCWAVHELAKSKLTNRRISQLMGLPVDTVSAYRYLYDEDTAVKQRVAGGELDITVFSRLKRQGSDIKEIILSKPGNISRAYVDDQLRREEPERVEWAEREQPETAVMSQMTAARLQSINDELEWLLAGELDEAAVNMVASIARACQNKLMED